MTHTLTKKEFISQYGYNSYNDIKEFILDNLMVLKYKRVISGYKMSNSKDYITIYLPYNKKEKKQQYININTIKLYALLHRDTDTFLQYVNNNIKEKVVV